MQDTGWCLMFLWLTGGVGNSGAGLLGLNRLVGLGVLEKHMGGKCMKGIEVSEGRSGWNCGLFLCLRTGGERSSALFISSGMEGGSW